jgi:hypothetical protein
MIPLFATLLFAHLVADFPLQTNKIYRWKTEGSAGVALHVAIHLLVTAVLLQEPWRYGALFIILGAAHFVIDWAKVRLPAQRQTPGFVLDQMAHVVTVAILAAMYPTTATVLPGWFLYPALVGALIPAILLLLWTVAIDMGKQDKKDSLVQWAQRRLLPLSQYVGMILLLCVITVWLLVL